MLSRLNNAIKKVEEAILSYSVLLMAFILIGSVLSRTFLNASWTFAEEVGQSLTIIVTFTGVSYCARTAKHITMSAVFDLLKPRYKKLFMLIISALSVVMMAYIGYLGYLYALKVFTLGRVSPSLRIPMYLIVAIVPIGFWLGALEYARTFMMNIRHDEVYLSSEVLMEDSNPLAAITSAKETSEIPG